MTCHFMMPERHTKSFSSYYIDYFRHVAMLQKYSGPLVEALFCGAPVRPNMLNMPKPASGPTITAEHIRPTGFFCRQSIYLEL